MASRSSGETITVGGHRFRLTHPEKVLYPETGTTKADVIHGDAVKLAEALQVMLTNSVEAGAHTITIVEQQGGDDAVSPCVQLHIGVQLHIIDDGAGLPSDAANRLFQPFFTTKTHGTGLGLVIAKKIIDAHGGHLTLEAHTPCGTKAMVWLPSRHNSPEEEIL